MESNIIHSSTVAKQTNAHIDGSSFAPLKSHNAVTPESLKLALNPLEPAAGRPIAERRSSFTPESPYQASDETRARQDLLDQDEAAEVVGSPGSRSSASKSTTHSPHGHSKTVNQVMGKATEMIGELAGIVAGVIPHNSANQDGGDDSVRFFVSSPETSRRESLQHGSLDLRRPSFTPESPYKVSDETRSRTNSLEGDVEGLGHVTVVPPEAGFSETRRTSGGSSASKYERLD